jgi:hypothetical protein
VSECENYILGKDETLVFVARAMDMGVFSVEMRKWMNFVIFLTEKGRLM